jgi:hypothetical protein
MTMPATAEFVINTTSEPMPTYANAGQAPTITVNGAPFAQLPAPQFPSGFQLLIMNAAGDLTSPESIWFNEYIMCQGPGGNWGGVYGYMYTQIVGAVLTSQNIEQQLIILASFGLDVHMTPDNDALGLLLPRGAGPALQEWASVGDPGSQGSGWVAEPASYILLGGPAYGYGDAWETFVATVPATATLNVTLQNNVPPTPPSRPHAEPAVTD